LGVISPRALCCSAHLGLDRYWRDLRTHSLHDPLGYKRRQVGAYLLTNEFPPSNDWYS
jgi:alkylation response protein AidB-like acyl-CoA dehydrogenase